jgi:hypothetical protein
MTSRRHPLTSGRRSERNDIADADEFVEVFLCLVGNGCFQGEKFAVDISVLPDPHAFSPQ